MIQISIHPNPHHVANDNMNAAVDNAHARMKKVFGKKSEPEVNPATEPKKKGKAPAHLVAHQFQKK